MQANYGNLLFCKQTCKWTDCKKVFDLEKQVFDHVKLNHIRENNATQCSWGNCKIQTSSKWILVSHMNTHMLLVHTFCYVCDTAFKKVDERRHFKYHTRKERDFNDVVNFLFQ